MVASKGVNEPFLFGCDLRDKEKNKQKVSGCNLVCALVNFGIVKVQQHLKE
jgi:hypothetical protein